MTSQTNLYFLHNMVPKYQYPANDAPSFYNDCMGVCMCYLPTNTGLIRYHRVPSPYFLFLSPLPALSELPSFSIHAARYALPLPLPSLCPLPLPLGPSPPSSLSWSRGFGKVLNVLPREVNLGVERISQIGQLSTTGAEGYGVALSCRYSPFVVETTIWYALLTATSSPVSILFVLCCRPLVPLSELQ